MWKVYLFFKVVFGVDELDVVDDYVEFSGFEQFVFELGLLFFVENCCFWICVGFVDVFVVGVVRKGEQRVLVVVCIEQDYLDLLFFFFEYF